MTGSAIAMVNACFRHQHPEAYGGDSVQDAVVPAELRYGQDVAPTPTETIPEAPMGNGEVLAIEANYG